MHFIKKIVGFLVIIAMLLESSEVRVGRVETVLRGRGAAIPRRVQVLSHARMLSMTMAQCTASHETMSTNEFGSEKANCGFH